MMKNEQRDSLKKAKTELTAAHQKQYERSMKYTRYMYIRYFLAILFFSNLYWLASLLVEPRLIAVMPVVVMLSILAVYFQMMKLQSNPEMNTVRMQQFFKLNIVITGGEILALWINCRFFFPYVEPTVLNQLILTLIFIASITFSLLSIRQMHRIAKNEDNISRRLAKL